METNTQIVSIDAIAQAFTKIYNGLDKKYITWAEGELAKIVPSPNSKVQFSSGYSLNDNRISVDIFVSEPQTNIESKEVQFDKAIRVLLEKADMSKLKTVMECINLLEKKDGTYIFDGINVMYSKNIQEYYFHFIVSKN